GPAAATIRSRYSASPAEGLRREARPRQPRGHVASAHPRRDANTTHCRRRRARAHIGSCALVLLANDRFELTPLRTLESGEDPVRESAAGWTRELSGSICAER